MNDSQISAAINSIRVEADRELGLAGADRCPTCGRPAAAPARRLVDGEIVEGCVDAHHTGHLVGADLAWHSRPFACERRAQDLAQLAEISGLPASPYTRAAAVKRTTQTPMWGG